MRKFNVTEEHTKSPVNFGDLKNVVEEKPMKAPSSKKEVQTSDEEDCGCK